MNKFLKSSVQILDNIKVDSNKIALIFEFENINNNVIDDLYFRFNINKYGIFEKIILLRNSKYLNCSKNNIYINSIDKNEKVYFGLILNLKNIVENIYKIETNIEFKIDSNKKEYFKEIKYISKDLNSLENENMLSLFNSEKQTKSGVIINYEVLFANNTDKEIEDIKIYLSIPDETEYVESSLRISQSRYKDFKDTITINKLNKNECIYIQYAVKVIDKDFKDKLVNYVEVLFTDIDKKELYIKKEVVSILGKLL